MFSSYDELVKREAYLKLDVDGQLVLDYPGELRVLDFHAHLSELLPMGRGRAVGSQTRPTYPTLPPVEALDLAKPYWTDAEFLARKYSGAFSVVRFGLDSIRILRDMVNGGGVGNCLAAQSANMILKSVILPLSTRKSDFSPAAIELAKRHPENLIPFCSVHPFDPDRDRKIGQYQQMGAKGLKLKISDFEMKGGAQPVVDLLRRCHEAGLPALFHTGMILNTAKHRMSGLMSRLLQSTRTELYGELLPRLPNDLVFIFGHSGVDEYRTVIRYMQRHPATYAELSSQSASTIKLLIEEVGPKRLLFGSDWPALPPAITLSRVLLATEGSPEARDDILYRNAERVLGVRVVPVDSGRTVREQ